MEYLEIRDIIEKEYNRKPTDTNHNFLSRFAKAVYDALPPPVANDAGRDDEMKWLNELKLNGELDEEETGKSKSQESKQLIKDANTLKSPLPSDAMVTEEDKGRRSFAEWCSSEGYTFWNLYKMWTHKLKPQLYLETEFLYQKWMQSLTDLNPKSK